MKRKPIVALLFCCVLALSLSACSSVAVMNKPLTQLAPPNENNAITTGGYRRAGLATNGASPELLVTLSFSGGGKTLAPGDFARWTNRQTKTAAERPPFCEF